MSVFDKKYIHCLWDDMLAGKEVFFADDVDCEVPDGYKVMPIGGGVWLEPTSEVIFE